MPRDPGLETILADDLRSIRGLTSKPMFGGLAWLLHGNLTLGARVDSLLVRLGKGHDAWALQLTGVVPMVLGERHMHGWVRADARVYGDDALRQKLIAGAVAFVNTLPRKPAR
jgi:TfoX N-terminal domain